MIGRNCTNLNISNLNKSVYSYCILYCLAMLFISGTMASCKVIEPSTTSSELQGIYDDKAILRLAKVSNAETDETRHTYKFETCLPSGDLCTGAFKNASGRDVLISFNQLNDLNLSQAEYLLLQKRVHEYFESKQASISKGEIIPNTFFMIGNLTVLAGVGISMHSLRKSTVTIANALLFKSAKRLYSGILMIIGGSATMLLSGFNSRHIKNEVKKTAQTHAKSQTGLSSLPHYLDIIKSTDPSKHQEVVGSSVYWITFALAQELNNNSLNQNVVDAVCFLNIKSQEVCEKLVDL